MNEKLHYEASNHPFSHIAGIDIAPKRHFVVVFSVVHHLSCQGHHVVPGVVQLSESQVQARSAGRVVEYCGIEVFVVKWVRRELNRMINVSRSL